MFHSPKFQVKALGFSHPLHSGTSSSTKITNLSKTHLKHQHIRNIYKQNCKFLSFFFKEKNVGSDLGFSSGNPDMQKKKKKNIQVIHCKRRILLKDEGNREIEAPKKTREGNEVSKLTLGLGSDKWSKFPQKIRPEKQKKRGIFSLPGTRIQRNWAVFLFPWFSAKKGEGERVLGNSVGSVISNRRLEALMAGCLREVAHLLNRNFSGPLFFFIFYFFYQAVMTFFLFFFNYSKYLFTPKGLAQSE